MQKGYAASGIVLIAVGAVILGLLLTNTFSTRDTGSVEISSGSYRDFHKDVMSGDKIIVEFDCNNNNTIAAVFICDEDTFKQWVEHIERGAREPGMPAIVTDKGKGKVEYKVPEDGKYYWVLDNTDGDDDVIIDYMYTIQYGIINIFLTIVITAMFAVGALMIFIGYMMDRKMAEELYAEEFKPFEVHEESAEFTPVEFTPEGVEFEVMEEKKNDEDNAPKKP